MIAGAEVSDAEVDAFVEEFQAAFVPGDEDEDAGPQPETVELASGPVRFLTQGEGEPVVLLHGFGGDLNNWLFAIPALAESHTVYALDLPGHGGSGKAVRTAASPAWPPRSSSSWTPTGSTACTSSGTRWAARWPATVAPARIASLTLVAPAGLGSEISREFLDGFVEAAGRRDLKPVLQLLFADESLVTRQLVDDVLKYKRIDGVQDALRAIAAAALHEPDPIADRLEALDAPVLVLWGAQDRIIAVPDRPDVCVIDGAGHSPHMEAAGEVNRLMTGFLESSPTSAAQR